MKCYRFVALAALTFALFAITYASAQQVNWDQYGFTPNGVRDNTQETLLTTSNVHTLKKGWTQANMLCCNPVSVDSAVAYVGANIGEKTGLYGLNIANGSQHMFFTNGYGGPQSPVTIDNGMIYAYFGDVINGWGGTLYALNEESYDVVWSHNFPGDVLIPITAADGVLYFGLTEGTQAGTVYAVNEANGDTLWSFQTGSGSGYGIWKPAAVANGVVYVGSEISGENGYLYALNASTGTELWSIALAGGASGISAPAVYEGYVFVSAGTELYGLVAADGAVAWEHYNSQGWGDIAVNTVSGFVYAPGGANGANLSAFEYVSGTTMWSYKNSYASVMGAPAVANGVVYFGDRSSYVFALNALTGARLWSYNVGGNVSGMSPVTAVDGGLFVVTTPGYTLYTFCLPAYCP